MDGFYHGEAHIAALAKIKDSDPKVFDLVTYRSSARRYHLCITEERLKAALHKMEKTDQEIEAYLAKARENPV